MLHATVKVHVHSKGGATLSHKQRCSRNVVKQEDQQEEDTRYERRQVRNLHDLLLLILFIQ